MYTIGIDLGTTGVKMLVMDETGQVLRTVSRSYPLFMDGKGNSEQNPEDWWNAVCDGLQELTVGATGASGAGIGAKTGATGADIAAISFSGQMHGLVMLDENDRVLRPAILWNDQRTETECKELNEQRELLLENTANIALTGFTLPKILWSAKHEPKIFAKVKKIMLPKDYIAYKMSGVFATDESDASGMLLLDVKNRRWSETMLKLANLEPDMLARVYPSSAVVGEVTAEAAHRTGLKAGTKVVIGGGDQAAGAVGTGTVTDGMCSISLGTSGVVFAACDRYTVDTSAAGIHSFCHANGKYHVMGVTLAAAASNAWWSGVTQTTDYAAEQAAIDPAKLGKNHVFYLPYLSGERSPINDPNARGVFYGMTTATTRADMLQAVLEGVAYSLRHNLEAMKNMGIQPKQARIIGGGAKSPLWCQIIADTLGLQVSGINSEEGPAYGAAILAAVGANVGGTDAGGSGAGGSDAGDTGAGGSDAFSSVEEACARLIRTTCSYESNPEAAAGYDEGFGVYRRLYESLRGVASV